MLKKFQTVALTGCSDSIPRNQKKSVVSLIGELNSMGLTVKVYNSVFTDSEGKNSAPEKRARDLTQAFMDEGIDAIFDITGGDSANAILPYLDFEQLKSFKKPFYAYSDNSVLLNPLKERSGIPVYYYQIKFISENKVNRCRFDNLIHNGGELCDFNYTMLQCNHLEGNGIAGGNVRCTLKLFGTPYQPSFRDKVLFLESLGGSLERMETSLYQYKMSGAFDDCSSVLLGNFTEIAREGRTKELYDMALRIIGNPDIPVACTTEIGHQSDSKCLDYQMSF